MKTLSIRDISVNSGNRKQQSVGTDRPYLFHLFGLVVLRACLDSVVLLTSLWVQVVQKSPPRLVKWGPARGVNLPGAID